MTLLEAVLEDGATRRVVLRRCSPVHLEADPQSAETEFRLLARLFRLGLPVPRPLLRDSSGGSLGRPWLVLEHVAGEPLWSPPDPLDNALRMADVLARLHVLEGLEDFSFVPRQAVPQAPGATGDGHGLVLPPLRWPPRPSFARLLHGDYWPGNVLWRKNGIAAVIDWEDAVIGDPLADLAVARANLVWSHGPEPCRAFTRRYAELTGFDLGELRPWDIHAAWSMASHAGEYAEGWQELGRADITAGVILGRLQGLIDGTP